MFSYKKQCSSRKLQEYIGIGFGSASLHNHKVRVEVQASWLQHTKSQSKKKGLSLTCVFSDKEECIAQKPLEVFPQVQWARRGLQSYAPASRKPGRINIRYFWYLSQKPAVPARKYSSEDG